MFDAKPTSLIRETPQADSEEGQTRVRLSDASCLDELLHHLQGNAPLAEVDVGLARLDARRLAEIRRLALRQAETTRRALHALRRLLLPATQRSQAGMLQPMDAMRDALLHLYKLNQELLRWRQLATSAANYLERRDSATNDARQWLQEARARSEWPGMW